MKPDKTYMARKYIPAQEVFKDWHKDPSYVAAYDALEEEFALADAIFKAQDSCSTTPLPTNRV